jgi:hypothetical protein
MSHAPQPAAIAQRLSQAASLPDLLDAGFDAFEIIRITARRYQDDAPELLAAFMMAADAAVDGREALTVAPSLLPHGDGTEPTSAVPLGTCIREAAGALARLATTLHDHLTQATAHVGSRDDQTACQQAAQAAERIRELMTR